MNRTESIKANAEAVQYIPGGVNSPVRAFRSVDETPLFVKKAKGTTLTDVDGNRFTDYCLSWGIFLLGHSHPQVTRIIRQAVHNGTSYGIPTLWETALAKAVNRYYPSMERVRFVNSGTEAVMSAIRLARGFTRRTIVVKFDGCYHGHADHMLVAAGSGVASLTASSSAGVPDSFAACTVSLPFNDVEAVEALFRTKGEEIAAVILEPIPANMGVVLPCEGFLQCLRELTARYGSLLIFDEVITGFRTSIGGAQAQYGVTPDLTTLGKILGGGFPAAAFGGKAEIMALLAPDGPVYQAGTLSGNPVAMRAGAETVALLARPGYYEALEEKAVRFYAGLTDAIAGKGITLNHVGPMFTLFFTPHPVCSFADARKADPERFKRFFKHMFARGIYVSPSQFEANFLSSAHTGKELDRFVRAVKELKIER
jgi:glutamate-1-semialdehyde 2,1-aminomutase